MTCDLSPHHLPPYSLPLLPSCCLRKQASSHAFSLFPLLTSYCDHLHHSAVLSVTPLAFHSSAKGTSLTCPPGSVLSGWEVTQAPR